MTISDYQYFWLFTLTLVLVGVLTPVMRKIAISKEIIDLPSSAHKSHKVATPYLGGVAIIFGVVFVTYAGILVSNYSVSNLWLATTLLAPAVGMGIIGLIDDIKNLPPFPRLIGQSIAGFVTAIILISTNSSGNPTGSVIFDFFITVIWVVGVCNSINFFDNLDGGAAGTSAIIAIGLTIIAISNDQTYIAASSIVCAAATLGFLIWNKSPAKIYMGDAGALFLGTLLATLSIRLNPETETKFNSFMIPILLLAIPILDTSVAVLSRLRRKISPFQGGKDHLSHRLLRFGISRKATAFLLWGLSALFVTSAIFTASNLKVNETLILLSSTIFWMILFLRFYKSKDL